MSDFGHRGAAEAVANGGLGLISGARDGPDGLGVMRQGGGGEVRTDPAPCGAVLVGVSHADVGDEMRRVRFRTYVGYRIKYRAQHMPHLEF